MRIDGSAVRAGMVIEYEGRLWQVVKHEIRTPGNLRGFNQLEIRDVKTGNKNNIRVSSDEKVERATLEQRDCSYLFADGDMLTFMDDTTYDQFTLPLTVCRPHATRPHVSACEPDAASVVQTRLARRMPWRTRAALPHRAAPQGA